LRRDVETGTEKERCQWRETRSRGLEICNRSWAVCVYPDAGDG